MVGILLKHIGTKSINCYMKEVNRISQITITAKSSSAPKISIYSLKEIENQRKMIDNRKTEPSHYSLFQKFFRI